MGIVSGSTAAYRRVEKVVLCRYISGMLLVKRQHQAVTHL